MPSPLLAFFPRGRLRYRSLRTNICILSVESIANGERPTCRICWEEDGTLLANTCLCTGSLAFVHDYCLLRWRRLAHNPDVCATCRKPIQLPAGIERKVWFNPGWAEAAQQQLSQFRQRPLASTFRWWNRGAVAAGILGAAASGWTAWAAAPSVAMRLRQVPLGQRSWPILFGVAGVAIHQCAWLPWLHVSKPTLGLQALCYAAGAVLDCCGLSIFEALKGGQAAAALGCWISKAAIFVGMGLQVVAMQQIHPLVRFVSGYVRGVEMACSATGNLLGRCAALLVSGCLPGSKALAGGSSRMMGKKGKLLLKLLRALPFVMHSFPQSLGAAGLIRL